MKTKPQTISISAIYSSVFLSIFLGSLLIPFMTVSAGLIGLLDGFKGKARFITAYTETRLLLGDQVFNSSIVGSDGWLYFTGGFGMTGYQRTQSFSMHELQKIQLVLESFQRRVEADGSVLLFVIPPDKENIYPEHVPVVVPRREERSSLDQLVTHLNENDSPLRMLDLRPTMLEVKQTYPVYYATDTHWNPIGAFFAYQKIIETLHLSFPDLSPHSMSDYKVVRTDPALMNISRIIGSTSLAEASFALLPIYQPQATMVSIDMTSPSGLRQFYFSHTDNKNAPTALIFHDSFFIAMRPFVSEHFSQAVYIDYFATPDISLLTWYEQFHPDVVILEITERMLRAIPSLFDS